MKKIVLIVAAIAILTFGLMTAVYAIDNNPPFNFGYRGQMMYQNNNGAYNSMIDIMRANGFEAAAKAMESRDFDGMNDFMNNMTDEQYNQMIKIMNDNGYYGMSRMMGSFNREGMINMHRSMMRTSF
jgi:hypothetical protein